MEQTEGRMDSHAFGQHATCDESKLRSYQVYLHVDDRDPIGSLSSNQDLLYKINLMIDGRHLKLIIFRKAYTAMEMYKSAFSLLFCPDPNIEGRISVLGPRLAKHIVRSFDFEMSNQLARVNSITGEALECFGGRSLMYHIVKMTLLCDGRNPNDYIMKDILQEHEWGIQENFRSIEHGKYQMTIWASFSASSRTISNILLAYKSSVDATPKSSKTVSGPTPRRIREPTLTKMLSPNDIHSNIPSSIDNSTYEGTQGPKEGMASQGSRRSKLPPENPRADSTVIVKPSNSDSGVDVKKHLSEDDEADFHAANEELNFALTQAHKHWQRSEDRLQESQECMLAALDRPKEKLALELDHLRKVSRFWLGLERLRDEKITQFLQGSLPEDDIVFQEALTSAKERNREHGGTSAGPSDKPALSSDGEEDGYDWCKESLLFVTKHSDDFSSIRL